ncbi:hypothetical protein Pmani_011968 [Petrolisthes manimaculis]|uniref:Thioredoxin domain-containing protein n=1 Tax=Petrolisthes manimaculis TaxID=1843537 RepID=A0AAE1Q044_9EUCA|nr:hypothetical protein Pmani_011968 [Petrolisthes manimaculis]
MEAFDSFSDDESDDEWFLQSIRRYEDLLMYKVQGKVTCMTFLDPNTLLVAISRGEVLEVHELWELRVPDKLVTCGSAGLVRNRDFTQVAAGYTKTSICQVLWTCGGVVCSGPMGVHLYSKEKSDVMSLVKDIRSDVKNASMAGSGFIVYLGEKPTNITSTNLGSSTTKHMSVESKETSSCTDTISKMSVINDNLFVGLKERGKVLVYDSKAGQVIQEIKYGEVCGGSWSMDVSQDGSTVVLAASNGAISIHDTRNCTQPLFTSIADTESGLQRNPDVRISPAGSHLSLSGYGISVQILDYQQFEGTSKNVFVHDGHRGAGEEISNGGGGGMEEEGVTSHETDIKVDQETIILKEEKPQKVQKEEEEDSVVEVVESDKKVAQETILKEEELQKEEEEDSVKQKEEEEEDSVVEQQVQEEEAPKLITSTRTTLLGSLLALVYQRDKIMLFCKVSFVLLALVLVVQSRGPIIRRASPSQPFFPRHSLVTDFYTGDVHALTDRLLASDLSLVVYYAPWDRDSQLLRWELEKAARYHHEQIYFAAINCWQPGSECKSRYKIRTYPAVVLHVRSSSGLETRALAYGGPLAAPHLIRFLARALHPLSHVASYTDLARLQMEHNAVVLGYYNFASGQQLPRGFTSFYLGSLRAMQTDNANSVAWAVVTNPRVATALSLNVTHPIHLVLWNSTLVFTTAKSSGSEAISQWVNKRLAESASWLHLPGMKSFSVDKLLQKGPTLMLFTPDNPYHRANDPFTLLREVSLEYNNCNQSSRVSNLARYLSSARTSGRRQLRNAEKMCRRYIQNQLHLLHLSRQQLRNEDEICCRTLPSSNAGTPDGPSNVCDVCAHPVTKEESLLDGYCSDLGARGEAGGLLQHVNSLMTVFSDSCRELVLQYSPWEQYPVCCQLNNTYHTRQITDDPLKLKREEDETGQRDDLIEKMVAMAAEDQCKRLFHGSLLAPSALLKDQHPSPDVVGLGCKTNRTMSFIAVDSLRHKDVAEKLGVNLTTREPPNTVAVIVDSQKESHFILDASLSKQTLANFIIDYTKGHVDRTLVSGKEGMTSCEDSQLCIRELTSENYLRFTQQPGEMVVVLHHSGNCAACSSMGHLMLMTAHAARHLPNVTFARINLLHNTLPWHLTFHTLPTIIVHPHFRKGDSQVLDSSQALTPASLLTFLVSNMEPRHRLALALDMCSEECRTLVLQQAMLATSHLHHGISQANNRLHHILAQLVPIMMELL